MSPYLRRTRWIALGMGVGVLSGVIAAQTTSAPGPMQQGNSATLDQAREPQGSLLSDQESQTSLSASHIISILETRPEVVVEIKTLVAQSQPGNISAQADAITDEALFNEITASRELRQEITAFLRARGYVNDDDLSLSDQGAQRYAVPLASSLTSPQIVARQPLQQNLQTPADDTDLQRATSLYTRAPGGESQRPVPQIESESRSKARERDNITSEPAALHRPAPYNLRSLRDLYSQIPDSSEQLRRFGSDVFTRRDRAVAGSAPLDVPLGPDYVVGPGDGLTISLWGGISQSFKRMVGPDGHLTLPEAGDIQVAGLTIGRTQELVEQELRRQYRDVRASVTLARLRTIRVYVVGDVQRPGAYEVSSLASPLSALYASGGPTSIGSLRVLKHYRGKQLVGAIDLYDFLLRGVQNGEDRLQGGDTLVVPAVGPQVAIWGAVKRPAIYELNGETTLGALLRDAGGVTVAASLQHISIDRINANQSRETISIGSANQDETAIAAFELRDGDRIYFAPIAPYSERVVYVEGHVVRPGKHPYRDGMRLSDVIQSYQDLLPEPASAGEIVRLVPPDLHVQTIEFNLADALIGNGDIALRPFDTVRILGRYDVDAPKVEIRGEVLRPGSYPLSEGMTAADLVRTAGGFKRDALVDTADLTSYRVVNGTGVESQRADIRIGDAVTRSDLTADRKLKPGDVLTIHQITGWNDIGESITIEGEVAHPGSYGFRSGERLSDVLRRAGGFRETAYPAGAILTREQVKELEEKSRSELIRQIETSASAARLSSNLASGDPSAQAQLIRQQEDQILSQLKNQPATGRLVIHVTTEIASWAGTAADIEVRRGDVLRIPKRPGFVLVSGQVYNASAITFSPGKTAGWYLQHAGGATSIANRKEIFVIRANGAVVGRRSGEWYDRDVLSTRLEPGDVVVVPQKIIGASLFWRNLLSTAQIASSIAITAAVAGL
jgi:protein involved in polysaccharide export with SLBB domain